MGKLNEIKYGAVLSYVLIIITSCYGLLISPFIVKVVGVEQYGLYKIIASFSASLMVLDLGFGSTVTRYIAKFRAEKDKLAANNFIAMSLIEVSILAAIVLFVGVILAFFIKPMYSGTFTKEQFSLAYKLYFIMIINMLVNFVDHVFWGVIKGEEKFIFSNSIRILSIVIRSLAIFLLLPIFKNVLVTSIIQITMSVGLTILGYIYIRAKLGYRIKLAFWDKHIFKESFGYTVLMFIQAIIVQFNGNVDNVVIGAVQGAAYVAIYSFALQIFNMYENLSTSFSGLMLPRMSQKIYDGATPEELQSSVVRVGRFQFAMLGGALGGFLVLGREFFKLWLGNGFSDCWSLSLILMIPVMFPLVQNTCLAILRAKNLMKFRTISLMVSFVSNCILTIVGTRYFGYWAAALGTASSTLIGLVTMNVYYHNKLGFKIFKMFCAIFKKTIICIMIAMVVTYILHKFFYGSWLTFVINAVVFLLVYAAGMFWFGFDKNEKRIVLRR